MNDKIDTLNDQDNMIVENYGEDISSLVDDRYTEFWNSLHLKESILRQKSRQLWFKDRDKNSRYFHNTLKCRRRGNMITAFRGRNGFVEGVAAVKEELKGHFAKFFNDNRTNRPMPANINFKCLNDDNSAWLERPFSEDDIKDAVWDCDGNKSMGPDGYSLEFFKRCWDFVKQDVFNFVKDFFKDARLLKVVISSFITLIPNIHSPQSLKYFIPI